MTFLVRELGKDGRKPYPGEDEAVVAAWLWARDTGVTSLVYDSTQRLCYIVAPGHLQAINYISEERGHA